MDNRHKETFHSHRGLEILFIHQGRGTMIVNNVSYAIRPGMLCVFQPFQLHHLQLEYTEGQTFERSLVIFEPSRYASYMANWPSLHAFFNRLWSSVLPAPCIYGIDEQSEVVAAYRSMQLSLPTLSEADQHEEASLFLIQLIRSLKPLWLEQQDKQPASALRMRRNHQAELMLEWLEGHYALPFHLEDMAKELHLSTYHLSHSFKEAVGVSMTEYIAARRMHQAVILLTTTDKPITLIAEEIGITNSSYFCKFFKSRMGTTPHQYRKRSGG